MTINHIDQLAEWYESAERITKTNLPRSGDYVISPFFNGTGFHVELEPDDWTADIVREEGEDARILSRAPEPKPAWHDAVAVMADDGDGDRMVWVRADEQGKAWESADGFIRHPSELNSPTPLIEAKVADEMVERIREASRDGRIKGSYWDVDGYYRAILTAALGIEAE